MNSRQPVIEIRIPEDHYKFLFFVHNKGQMYFPKQDEAFGSYYFHKSYHPPKNQNYTYRYQQSFRLERTHWKTLPTENQRCGKPGNSGADTTTCITRYLEQTVGCSMGLLGTDPDLKRYHCKFMYFVQNTQKADILRCNKTNQVEHYAVMAKEIQYAINDTEIFRITGCLSRCDKYHYNAQPRSDMKIYRTSDRPSAGIQFIFSNGKNEVKEQVMSEHNYGPTLTTMR